MSSDFIHVGTRFNVDRDPEVSAVESNRRMHEAGFILAEVRRGECSRNLGCVITSMCTNGTFVSVQCASIRPEGGIDGCAQVEHSAAETRTEFLEIAESLKTPNNS